MSLNDAHQNMPQHERLQAAIEAGAPGKSFEEKCEALRSHIRDQGVHGHHATRFTLQRWTSGRGNPPPYWIGLAADFLGVSYRWLAEGEGVPCGKGAPKPMLKPQPPAPKAEPETGEPGEAKQGPPEEAPERPGTEDASIPTAEDVHASSSRTINDFLARTTLVESVEAILEHEPKNPNYEGGRETVLKRAKARLSALTEDA